MQPDLDAILNAAGCPVSPDGREGMTARQRIEWLVGRSERLERSRDDMPAHGFSRDQLRGAAATGWDSYSHNPNDFTALMRWVDMQAPSGDGGMDAAELVAIRDQLRDAERRADEARKVAEDLQVELTETKRARDDWRDVAGEIRKQHDDLTDTVNVFKALARAVR
jgi:hypothetical protein